MVDLPQGVSVYITCDGSVAAPRGSRRITCFRCGEFGHYRGECRSFKVQLCMRHRLGDCSVVNCPFAHGAAELRKPWLPKCVRVVKTGGWVEVLGCGEVGHTFRDCPHRPADDPRCPHGVSQNQSVDTSQTASVSKLTE